MSRGVVAALLMAALVFQSPAAYAFEFRTIDGSGNNLADPAMGAAGTMLIRRMTNAYGDGASSMGGAHRAGAREVSNAVCMQTADSPNAAGASDFLWQWGQFLDHDIDLTESATPVESADIPVPMGDPFFDPGSTGLAVIGFNRSGYDRTMAAQTGMREQTNGISAWIDASNVYGSDRERAAALRTNDGSGRLKMTESGLLPRNTAGLPNAGGPGANLFLAGDIRANEQVGLTTMHTLFVREHNRIAGLIADASPQMSGEEVYQRSRRIVGALMQVITYRQYLPTLFGRGRMSVSRGYKPARRAAIMNEFSTAAYRWGHSALSPQLLRLDALGNEIAEGHLALREAFFAPHRITDEGGIEPILRGLASQRCQEVDAMIVDDVRNFLFGPPGSGGFDLASLNIQRGRDHGLPSYDDARAAIGLKRVGSFGDITRDREMQERLASVYRAPEDVDLWVGLLAEDKLPRSLVGPLAYRMMREQFEALRDGDRLWWRRELTKPERRMVRGTRLSDVIRRNTSIDREIRRNVFRAH